MACSPDEATHESKKEDPQVERNTPVCSVQVDLDIDTSEFTVKQRTHLFRTGQTLWNLSRDYYGNRHYSAVVALYNNIDDVNTIKDSTLLQMPALDTLLKDEKLGLVQAIPNELDLLLEARELFQKHERKLFEIRGDRKKGTVLELASVTVNDLKKAEENILKCIKNFKSLEDSLQPPQKVYSQLQQVATNVNQLARGQHDGPYGYDLDMFHQNLIHALKYLISWKKNDK